MSGVGWRESFRWPLPTAAVWLALPAVCVAFGTLVSAISPHDYWYALALGRQIEQTGSIPRANLFLYSLPADTPWHPQAWLGHWLLYLGYDAGGHVAGAAVLSGLLLVSFALVTDRALRRSGAPRIAGGLTALGAVSAYHLFSVRTQMFAFALFAFLVWVLTGVADRSLSRRWLWALVPATALWANLHGSWVLAGALTGLVGAGALIEERRRRGSWPRDELGAWAVATALLLACGAASPVGRGNYAYLGAIGALHGVTEWQPPKLGELRGALALGWVAGGAVLLFVRRKELALWEPALLAALGALALTAERNAFWLSAVAPIVLSRHFAALRPVDVPAPSRVQGLVNAALLAAMVGGVIALEPGVLLERARLRFAREVRRDGPGAGLLSVDNPTRLVAHLRSAPEGQGRIFHDQRVGGLLEYQLTEPGEPRPVAFVDQRMELVPDAVWERYFRIGRAEGWEPELDALGVDRLLLHRRAQAPLLDAAIASGRWHRTLEDGPFVLLARGAAR